MNQHPSLLKFSESGVRGVVGSGLTPHLVTELVAAFGLYQGGGRILIGRDTRPTGEMLEHAVTAGLLAVGCQVIKLGIVPTPTLQLLVRELNAAGGIAITASHNPAQWNALKFVSSGGVFLDQTEAAELFDIYSQGNFAFARESELREVSEFANPFALHAKRIFQAVDTKAIRERRLKVAVDCCNGVGAVHSRGFLEKLGCEVVTVNSEPDGRFRRVPEPLPEHLGALAGLVKREKCDIGFAQDPDGDRLTLVDDTARVLSPQWTVALAFEHILEAYPGPVAVNLQTTHLVEKIAGDCGCEVFYSKVGEINVVQKMRECNAAIGGEGNCGGVIWRRIHPCRDSFSGMAILLEMLALSGSRLSDIVDSLPNCCNRSMRFELAPKVARHVVETLCRRYADQGPLTFDGFRLNLPDGWVLVRSSNTEPILRLNVERESEAATESLLKKFAAEIEEIIKEAIE
ncbi:MAG: phosphoglucosamine mutase [Victivallaceae bacterium]